MSEAFASDGSRWLYSRLGCNKAVYLMLCIDISVGIT